MPSANRPIWSLSAPSIRSMGAGCATPRLARVSIHVNYQFLGEHRTDILPTMDHFLERCHEFCARAVFGDITRRAGFESASRVLILSMHAEDQYRELWVERLQFFQDFQ